MSAANSYNYEHLADFVWPETDYVEPTAEAEGEGGLSFSIYSLCPKTRT